MSRLLELLSDDDQWKNVHELTELSKQDPINSKLSEIARWSSSIAIHQRRLAWTRIRQSLDKANIGQLFSPEEIWSHLLPLVEVINSWHEPGQRNMIGLAGLPGSGKTTLSQVLGIIAREFCGLRIVAISLDDFYLTPAERRVRGLRWRAVPGSHDMELLQEFLEAVRTESKSLNFPRYDSRAEVRLQPEFARADTIIFDGWLLGARASGYETLEDAFDRVILIDMDLELAHQSRLQREARIREESNGQLGMTAEDTERFWQEALLPTGRKCISALRQKADLVIEVDASHHFISVSTPASEI